MKEELDILGYVSTIISLISTAVSVAIWLRIKTKEKFNEQRIKIQLKVPNTTQSYDFPYEIERKFLSRSELQGLLGILPVKNASHRYSLSFLTTIAYFDKLKAAQDDENTTAIEIICTQAEWDDFDWDKIPRNPPLNNDFNAVRYT